MIDLPSFADIEAADAALRPYAIETPLVEHGALNERLGLRVFLKLETFQRTGSFKFRGAFNRIRKIAPADRAKGVVAFSSGNHAQGVAAAAALFSMPALIVMPKDVPPAKLAGTRALGADVVFYDRYTDDREAMARALCAERGAVLVPPYDDPAVVAGQGTVGLEIARAAAARGVKIDAVLAPCSGGGLVSGIALALSQASRGTRIVSVEPENFDGMRQSFDSQTRVAAKGGRPSIADALMAPMPGEVPFALARKYLSGAITISDDALVTAVNYTVSGLKLVVEPSGAAALAALLAGKYVSQGGCVAVVLSGANVGLSQAAAGAS